jgi:hypothetical protein
VANLKSRLKQLENIAKEKQKAIDPNPEYTTYLKNLSDDDLNALYQGFEREPTTPKLLKLFETSSNQEIINLFIQGCKS